MLKTLSRLLESAGISLKNDQKEKLLAYLALLKKWNRIYNFTSIKDPKEMLVRHILDSIIVEPYLIGTHFIDIGTGAGLPGIPLAIVRPESSFVLLDSLGKRIYFIKQVKYELQLNNIIPIQNRVENFLAKQLFDGVLSRAFSSLKNIVNCSHHLLGKSGKFYSLKGCIEQEEITALPTSIQIEKIYHLSVPELKAVRHLVILSSSKTT